MLQILLGRKKYEEAMLDEHPRKGRLTRNDLHDTICITIIRFMTTFINFKSLHTNLKIWNSSSLLKIVTILQFTRSD